MLYINKYKSLEVCFTRQSGGKLEIFNAALVS